MRKFLVSAVLAASAAGLAAPAAAQWAPPQPQGYAYGYNNHGQVRRLEVRLQQIRQQIRQLDRRGILNDREAYRLNEQARELQYRIRQLGYNGLNGRERFEIERRIARLEQRLYRDVNDGNRNRYDPRIDRDRDGRDDRREDDRGRWPG